MNHDDDNELFNRLEADMAANGAVVDFEKARAARDESPDDEPTESADPSPDESGTDKPTESGTASAGSEPTVMVDSPDESGPAWLARMLAGKRAPIRPDWLRSAQGMKEKAGWVTGLTLHTLGYHGLRLPYYAAVLALRSPLGALHTLGRAKRWVWDAEGEAQRQVAATRDDPDDYLKLSRQRDRRVRFRATVAVLSIVVGLPMALIIWAITPAWLHVLATLALVAALGFAGAPADKPIVTRAVVPTEVEKPTSGQIERALGALGIAEINKALAKGGEGVKFPHPVRQDGPGWRADVDLPYGVTVPDILDRREKLASGLRRPLGCVWPEPVPDEHAGRMLLWVGMQPLNKVKDASWPLAKTGRASLFKPIPFGTDQRGRRVDLTLMYDNMLIGAMPGMGKTFALRNVLLAAALDVLAELHVWELKGTGDLSPVEKVAADYGSGAADDATMAATMGSVRYVYGELERRAKVIASLPKDMCRENKVTPELAAMKSLKLHPLVLAIDECQELFAHETYGKEAAALCTGIIKRGRALGVILLLATQRPDKDSLPTSIRANIGTRFCLRMMGHDENDMVLGTGMHKRGIQATLFSKKDLGIGYLAGAMDDPQIVRGYNIDNVAADAICERARAARARAGTLTGVAAGEQPERRAVVDTLLDDIIAVVPASEPKVWSEAVVARLAELRPELYGSWKDEAGEWDAARLSAALKPYGVKVVQVNRRIGGKVVNRRGIERADIVKAIAERDGNCDAG